MAGGENRWSFSNERNKKIFIQPKEGKRKLVREGEICTRKRKNKSRKLEDRATFKVFGRKCPAQLFEKVGK